MEQRKKVGIMGGTFDPIHIGHLTLAREAKRQFGLEEVIFMPTGDPWHKAGRPISPAADRSAMVLASLAMDASFGFSDMEIVRKGTTYTAQTLCQLRREHPDWQCYYIVGADSLDYMERWYRPDLIFQNAVILAACRTSYTRESLSRKMQQLQAAYGGDIRFLDAPDVPISSSEIRKMVREGKDISAWVVPEVMDYIKEKGLYRQQ